MDENEIVENLEIPEEALLTDPGEIIDSPASSLTRNLKGEGVDARGTSERERLFDVAYTEIGQNIIDGEFQGAGGHLVENIRRGRLSQADGSM